MMGSPFAPGQWVRLPAAPQWGRGQVQSVAANRVTVNFEHGGKQLIDTRNAILQIINPAGDFPTS